MNRSGNPATLAHARRRASLDKRQRILTALAALEYDGTPITFTAVARAAGVSTWLTYSPRIREHIEAARRRQHTPSRPGEPPAAPAALRMELDLAHHEIRQLRTDRDRLKTAVRHQLGQQLDTLTAGNLTARVDELTQSNKQLTNQLRQATAENTILQQRLTAAEADLTAARTSLRRMIRTENVTR
ncbi:hypothetical protein [Streptomyces sp. NPDC051452]|uniref:hypothetical protein n=1 Tax=Streptomyces sp. NPDC051452 TaxID=3365654 RepID=UPI0037A06826